MKVTFGDKKWQILSIVLAVALATSLGFNVYQAFNGSNSASNGPTNTMENMPMNFTFTWEPDNQGICNGTFRLAISMLWVGENVSLVVKANDDEYDEWDYIGLVFDTNQNGYIDHNDEPYGLFANNLTAPSILTEHGFLCFAEVAPQLGPQRVTFNPNIGYIFQIQFPYDGRWPWNPSPALKTGRNNPMHVCFHDESTCGLTLGVFATFAFYIPEE